MQEITTLTALVMRRARDLIADYGWPDHTDVDQRDPVNKPGWISIYVRLDAANIVHLLPLLCTGDVPAELQSAMTKIAGTPAQIILSGSRYADAPQLPEDGTQIAFPWAGEWLTEYQSLRNSKLQSCLTYFVFEQITKRLNDIFKIYMLRKSAYIVV